MKRVAGIDPGNDVGIALICEDGRSDNAIVPKLNKEVDASALRQLLAEWKPTIVYIEKVHAMPGQGVSSVFSFGAAFGTIKGVLVGLGIPYQLVTPQKWKKVLEGMPQGPSVPKGADAKTRSRLTTERKKIQKQSAIAFAKARYPKMPFRASARARTDNINMGDAACIAHHGFVSENGKPVQQTVEPAITAPTEVTDRQQYESAVKVTIHRLEDMVNA
jgi:Holliday junction resolvasome RuvABC endonuclease subunit